METSSVIRASGSAHAQCELEDTDLQSSTPDQESIAELMGMLACNVILLLMLAA